MACVNKYKGNAIPAFFPFEHQGGQMAGVGHTNDQASRYDQVVFGRYLLGWLTNLKVK